MIAESFSGGLEVYKKNFTGLLALAASRLAAVIGLVLLALVLIVPIVASGVMDGLSSPEALVTAPGALRYASFLVAYVLLLLVVGLLLLPFFLYPHVAGAVAADKGKLSFEGAFGMIRKDYVKILITTLVYCGLVAFLSLESMFFIFASPFVGIALLFFTLYVSIRLSFWDVLLFMGEKHPLRASWELTQERFWVSSGFVFVANVLNQLPVMVPLVGVLLGFLVTPWMVTSKVRFVSLVRKGFNKKRRK